MKIMMFMLVLLPGCAVNPVVIDDTDKMIDAECALKNSVPSIHDKIL